MELCVVNPKNVWFHGTPDAREVIDHGGFIEKAVSVDYVVDLVGMKQNQEKMNIARKSGDWNTYHKLLDMVSSFKRDFAFMKPVFLSNKYSVARTYANPWLAFDYQNSIERVYAVNVDCKKVAKITAPGERFRFISVARAKNGFMDSGIPEEEIDGLIEMFNYYVLGNKGIQTNIIASIGSYLGFDCVDVVGTLDSFNGGSVRSTVRMVLNSSNIRIVDYNYKE